MCARARVCVYVCVGVFKQEFYPPQNKFFEKTFSKGLRNPAAFLFNFFCGSRNAIMIVNMGGNRLFIGLQKVRWVGFVS